MNWPSRLLPSGGLSHWISKSSYYIKVEKELTDGQCMVASYGFAPSMLMFPTFASKTCYYRGCRGVTLGPLHGRWLVTWY